MQAWQSTVQVVGIAMGLAVAAAPAAQAQQKFPTKPVRLVVGFSPGSATDITGRLVAQKLSDIWGQPVVIENRSGAGGQLATVMVAKATPDGYVLLISPNALAFNVALYAKLPYNTLRDFAPISLIADQPNILVVHPALPVKSFQEYVALARSQPGKLVYGSGGIGVGSHLAMELLLMSQKLELVHVPYKGVGPALTALLGNEASALLSTFASALPHVKAGRLRALGVTSAKRAPALPDVPTIAESGVPGFSTNGWNGMLVPAGTPRSIIRILNEAVAATIKSPYGSERIIAGGAEPAGGTPEELNAMMVADHQRWSEIVRTMKIDAE